MQNKLFTVCHSGFIPGDSCVSQLLSVTHEIYQSVDCHPPTDIRSTFPDISKSFDKVWHEGLIFKLKTCGRDAKLLKLWENYLTDHHQRVVLNSNSLQPSYLQNYLTPYDNVRPYLTWYVTQKPKKTFRGRSKAFESFFFPYCAKEWGNLNGDLRNINLKNTFKLSILNLVKPQKSLISMV